MRHQLTRYPQFWCATSAEIESIDDTGIQMEEKNRQDIVQRIAYGVYDLRLGKHPLDQTDIEAVVQSLVGDEIGVGHDANQAATRVRVRRSTPARHRRWRWKRPDSLTMDGIKGNSPQD